MKKTAALLTAVLSLNAFGQGLQYVPKWKMVNGKACYEFEDAQLLVELDIRFAQLTYSEQMFSSAIEDYKRSASNFETALKLDKSSLELLKNTNDDLGKRLLAETERANKAEASKPAWSTLVLGGAGLVAVGVVAGVLLGVAVAVK